MNGANTFINSDFNKGRFLDGEQGRLQKALILTILDFRRIEFLYEGQRYYDILRWNIPVTHRDNSGQTSTLTPDERPTTTVASCKSRRPRFSPASKPTR